MIRPTLVWLMCCELFISALIIIVPAASGEDDMAPGELGVIMSGFGRRYLPGAEGSGGTEGAGYPKRFVHKDNYVPEPSTTAPGPNLLGFAFR